MFLSRVPCQSIYRNQKSRFTATIHNSKAARATRTRILHRCALFIVRQRKGAIDPDVGVRFSTILYNTLHCVYYDDDVYNGALARMARTRDVFNIVN